MFEQFGVRSVENRRTDLPANGEADHVADESGQRNQRDEQPEVHLDGARRDEQTGNEQQGVTRQEEAEKDAAFGKNDQHDAEDGPRPHVVDQGFGAQPTGQ